MNEIVTVDVSRAIAEFKPWEAQLSELEETYGDAVYDMTDKRQNDAARGRLRGLTGLHQNTVVHGAEIHLRLLRRCGCHCLDSPYTCETSFRR